MAIGTPGAGKNRRPFSFAASAFILTLCAVGLAGCASGPNILSAFQPQGAPAAEDAEAPPATASLPRGKVAVAPVIGAPDAVARQLQTHMAAALEKHNIGVAKEGEGAGDYTVRGYVVSAREKSHTKISYIWDVTDTAGKRVNRITGEEIVRGPPGKDPWAGMTPQVSQSLAAKAASSLSSWLAANRQGAVAGGTPDTSPVRVATTSSNVPLPSGAGAISTGGPVLAVAPGVSGAPGNGNTALKEALQRELAKGGISFTNSGGGGYKVDGHVLLGQPKDGKQSIQIDWVVRDPAGKKLGTVSQKNDIPQGSLDNDWGKTADAAAAAAARGILKLLPQPRSVN